MMEDDAPYVYAPLAGDRSIRLLILEPAIFRRAPLHASLIDVSLDFAPKFHALSYVWGQAAEDEKMAISIAPQRASDPRLPGVDRPGGRLTLTLNCFNALRHLRYRFGTRAMWVDAICIDQQSNEDKSHQVQIMANIFEAAARVVVWLDLSDCDLSGAWEMRSRARGVMTLMRDVGSFVRKSLLFVDQPGYTPPTGRLKRWYSAYITWLYILTTRMYVDVMSTLLQNAYFCRVWTVQELAVKRLGDIEIATRSGHASWCDLVATVHLMHSQHLRAWSWPLKLSDQLDPRLRTHFIYPCWPLPDWHPADQTLGDYWQDTSSEVELLQAACLLDATVPHDKVYAMLWLFRSRSTVRPHPTVDYDKPLDAVAAEYSAHLIDIFGPHVPLVLAAITDREKHPDLPSWAFGVHLTQNFRWISDARSCMLKSGDFEANVGGPLPRPLLGPVLSNDFNPSILVPFREIRTKMTIEGIRAGKVARCFKLELASWEDGWAVLHSKQLAALAPILRHVTSFCCHDHPHDNPYAPCDATLGLLDQILRATSISTPSTTETEEFLVRDMGLSLEMLRLNLVTELTVAYKPGPYSPEAWDLWASRVLHILAGSLPGVALDSLGLLDGPSRTILDHDYFMLFSALMAVERLVQCSVLGVFHTFGWPNGATIFFTECGRVGSAARAAEGDLVTVLSNVNYPVLLRGADGDDAKGKGLERWRIVSPAYVGGITQGEAFDKEKVEKMTIV